MMQRPSIPREVCLFETRDAAGRLLTLGSRDRIHIRRDGEAWRFDDDFVTMRELVAGRAMHRTVATRRGDIWTETYRWDAEGRPIWIDGMAIERDATGSVARAAGPGGTWRYRYGDAGVLTGIDGPFGRRRIDHAAGRPVALTGTPEPHFKRDALGRVWQLRRPDGSVAATYLWDGYACLARIDGPPGGDAELAAVYSLDPSFTPVRVTTHDGVTRIPRDAFGEGLLQLGDGPGLHGGMMAGGHVHYRARSLDPRIGAYTSPDPWPGDATDPRRAGGYAGPLPYDPGPSAYAVCRNDPVARVDPTGEVSAGVGALLLSLSTLTWSSQHTLATMFGLDLLNLFLALVTGKPGRWFDKEGIYSRYLGSFGIRYDPVGLEALNINVGRAWTYQHIIWSPASEFTDLAVARVFVPATDFLPRLHGSILRVAVDRIDSDQPAAAFILSGSNVDPGGAAGFARAPLWSRCGGVATPAFPGSDAAIYPRGGLHFDAKIDTLQTPRAARIAELTPTGAVLIGRLDRVRALDLPAVGLGLVAGARLLLRDGAGASELATVVSASESGSTTRAVVSPATTGLALTGLRVRGVTAPGHPALKLSAGTPAGSLDPAGATGPSIKPGEVFALSQGPGAVGAVSVDRVSATVPVDDPIVAPTTPGPHSVHRLQSAAGGNLTVGDPLTVLFPAPAPAVNTAVEIGGVALRMLLPDPANVAERRVLDRALPATVTGAAAWLSRPVGTKLGVWPGSFGATTLIYDADGTGGVLAAINIGIKDGAGTLVMVRKVTAAATELLMVGGPLPGNKATPYDIERLVVAPGVDVSAATQATSDAAVLAGPVDAQLQANPQPALQILQTTGATATQPGPALLSNITMNAANEIVIAPPASLVSQFGPVPSQPIVLAWPTGTTGNTALALVRTVRLTVTLDRSIAAAAPPDGLTLIPLETAGYAYVARGDGPDAVQLDARACELTGSGAPDFTKVQSVQMPRFEAGMLVRLDWAATTEVFRVAEVDGCWLKLAGGGLAGPPAGVDIAVRKLGPALADSLVVGHGSHRLGLAGRITGTTPVTTTLEVEVPSPAALTVSTLWALSDGTTAHPCKIFAATTLTIALFSAPPGLAVGVGFDLCALASDRNGFAYAGDFTIDGGHLVLPAGMPGISLKPGVDTLVIVPYTAAKDASSAAGNLSGGTTMIPNDDTESWFLTRRESLETHELRHTQQSALMGPLMLSVIPLLLIDDLLARIGGGNLQAPEYSAYVAASVVSTGGSRRLVIPDAAGIPFDTGRKVQFAQDSQSPIVELGAKQSDGFTLPGSNALTLRDGPVSIRLQRTTGSEVFSWIQRIGSILSIGSVAQLVGSTIIMGIPTLIAQIIHAAKGGSFWDPYYLTWYPARIVDAARPAAIELLPDAKGKLAPLSRNDRVLIRADSKRTDVTTVVTAADGAKVELAAIPTSDKPDLSFEIASAGNADPTRSLSDQFFSRIYNAEWMGWVYDPWSRLHSAVDAPPDSAKDWIFRSARWAFSSTAWAPLLVTGIFFYDNLLKNAKKKGHLAFMEQQASETSGNLYSQLARQRGDLANVGDLARLRMFVAGGGIGTVIISGMMDRPGVHMNGGLMATLPSPVRGGAALPAPFGDRASAVASANQVPDQLYSKDLTKPASIPAGMPVRLTPSSGGFIPGPGDVEMSAGSYVAFCQPGAHFITGVPTNASEAADSEEAQTEGKQTIRFDVTVADVEVRAGGQLVAEGATLTVIPCQRLPVTVAPNGSRSFGLGLLRPAAGTVLRSPEPLMLQVQENLGTEQVEVRRVHAAQPFTITEDTAAAFPQVALDRPIVVPVRRFGIVIAADLAPRASLVPSVDGGLPPPIVEAKPGDTAFLVIPARLKSAVPAIAFTPQAPPAPPSMRKPGVTLAPEPIPPALTALVGDGAILRIKLDPADPPEEPIVLEWTAQVAARRTVAEGGGETPPADVRLKLIYLPQFRLLLPAAPVDEFGLGGTVDLTASDGVTVATVVVLDVVGVPSADVTAQPSPTGVKVVIAPAATVGVRRIVATTGDGRVGQRTIVVK